MFMYCGVLYVILSCLFFVEINCMTSVNGRYTRGIKKYQLTIPRKVTEDGSFASFKLPHYFEHDFGKRKRKRSLEDPHLIHYAFVFDGAKHHVELWPNHNFLSPNLVFEKRDDKVKVNDRILRSIHDRNKICHYTGRVRNQFGSRVALSTCDGLAGYIITNDGTYFIEPVAEHVPNESGQHLHLIYKKNPNFDDEYINHCGTSTSWEDAWKERFMRKYIDEENLRQGKQPRGLHSVQRYLETLIVCDKKFLEYHKSEDVETYVLTVMNMVADFYHDATSGNQMDVVVVRVIYLEKEEEEIDLIINPNADETLASFCKWQQRINPKDLRNPNHHDIAVLLTRHDICADKLSNCGLMGLAYVAAACTGDKPCAINEDGGLVLGIVVAHEMGHVMGCSHDKEDVSGCKSQDENDSYYVMAPYVHLDTIKWSTCSRTFITSFFDNDLGECLNDEPEISRYAYANMLPGSMYDAVYQCRIWFPDSEVCNANSDTFCEKLVCKTDSNTCMTMGEPPADGTKCGENKWCYKKKCVEMGERPAAVNGGWGEWSDWSACTRTCGGGVSYSERDCNNPVPKYKGRYCLGDRKKVKICNTNPCQKGAKPFRAVQCSEYDKKRFQDKLHKWEPFYVNDNPCTLFCINEKKVYSKLAPRAKDGTRCKPGTKNMCISGVCRKVGCDYVLDSDAVEDNCGICKGDGTQCKVTDETYTGHVGHDYVKVATIPKGSRQITIEELESSPNTIAISSADEKKFYLNGDFSEQTDGSHDFGGVEGVYTHPEPDKESLVIAGPLEEALVFHVAFYKNENKGYRYKYSEMSAQSTYQPRYHWEFLEWDECSTRCGGGIETSQASCMEEKSGKVTPSFCVGLPKLEPMKRKCNEQPCKTKWRVGKWGKCTACKFQSGVRIREVDCIKEAPIPGTEDILEEDDKCEGPKPGTRELCNSHKTCKRSRRDVDGIPPGIMQNVWYQTFEDFIFEKLPDLQKEFKSRRKMRQHCKIKNKEDHKENKLHVQVGQVVKDDVPPEEIKLVQVPLKQPHTSLNLSDLSFETMGDKVADSMETCKEKVFTGQKAAEMLKEFQESKNKSYHKQDRRNFF